MTKTKNPLDWSQKWTDSAKKSQLRWTVMFWPYQVEYRDGCFHFFRCLEQPDGTVDPYFEWLGSLSRPVGEFTDEAKTIMVAFKEWDKQVGITAGMSDRGKRVFLKEFRKFVREQLKDENQKPKND